MGEGEEIQHVLCCYKSSGRSTGQVGDRWIPKGPGFPLLLCWREIIFFVSSKALLKDSKHFIQISLSIFFHPRASNEGEDASANLNQCELHWLPWKKTQVACVSWVALQKTRFHNQSLCNSVSITPWCPTAPASCKDCPAFGELPISLQRATLKEFDSNYHMLSLFFLFWDMISKLDPLLFPATLRTHPKPKEGRTSRNSHVCRWFLHPSMYPGNQGGLAWIYSFHSLTCEQSVKCMETLNFIWFPWVDGFSKRAGP